MRRSKRVVVLLHANDRSRARDRYVVDHLARFWREDGHDVVYVFGVSNHVPGDLIFIHVDLSVVPDEYLAFASQYPVVVNGRLSDIRKSTLSANLVGRRDDWSGSVIVKSTDNFGGEPERQLAPTWRNRRWGVVPRIRRLAGRLSGYGDMADWINYRIFERKDDVPAWVFRRRDLVVERFLPELENGWFHLRMCQVLGDRWTCVRLSSTDPVVKASTAHSSVPVEPHPEVEMWRREFGVDYGKLDYVVHDGRAVLLDVNKTTGASPAMAGAELESMRRWLAGGLYSYWTTDALKSSRSAFRA